MKIVRLYAGFFAERARLSQASATAAFPTMLERAARIALIMDFWNALQSIMYGAAMNAKTSHAIN